MARNIGKSKLWENIGEQESTPTDTRTPTHTQEEKPSFLPPHSRPAKVKEPKSERLQLIIKPSTKVRLTRCAEDHETSVSQMMHQLIEDFLKKNGY